MDHGLCKIVIKKAFKEKLTITKNYDKMMKNSAPIR